MSRRTFVQWTAALTAGAAVGSLRATAGAQAVTQPSGGPHALGSSRHLFIDDWLTDEKQHVTLTVNPPENRQLVLIADKPWERNGISCYCNAFWDPITNEYRLYYVPISLESKPIFRLALATSKNGIQWEKPELNAVEWQGNKKNNIVIDAQREGTVVIDPDAPADRRYAYLSGDKAGIYYFSSPDGIQFKKGEKRISPHQSDSQISTFWDDQRKKYRHYFKVYSSDAAGKWNAPNVSTNPNIPYPQNEPLGRSVAFIETSAIDSPWDGEFRVVMARDPQDPTNMDLYTNAAQKYQLAPDVYVAFPTPYYHYNPAERAYLNEPAMKLGGKRNDGAIETQLAVSRDGITWTRLRAPYYPMWRYEELYLQVVMGFPGLIYKPTHIEQYFAAYNFTHGDTNARERLQGRKLGGVFRSTQRIDGFMSADFAYTGGTLTTRPFTFRGKSLLLNTTTSAAGEGRVAILDEAGKEIPGYAAKDCQIINGDFLDKKVQWTGDKNDLSSLAGQAIRLRFEMRGAAKLFSFRFSDDQA